MERGGVGDRESGSTTESCQAFRAHRHVDTRHLEGRGFRTDSRRFDPWRADRVGAAHQHLCYPWIGMIRGQRSRTRKGKGLCHLSWANGNARTGRRAPVIDRIEKLNGSTSRACRHVESSDVAEAR